jgi:hypothetical protein
MLNLIEVYNDVKILSGLQNKLAKQHALEKTVRFSKCVKQLVY